jgi:hypothetical protein
MKEKEMGCACSIHGEVRNAHTVLVGNPDGIQATLKMDA